MFQQFLIKHFSYGTAKRIYGFVLEIVVFFKKMGLFLSLPFKFVQFFRESWKERSKN